MAMVVGKDRPHPSIIHGLWMALSTATATLPFNFTCIIDSYPTQVQQPNAIFSSSSPKFSSTNHITLLSLSDSSAGKWRRNMVSFFFPSGGDVESIKLELYETIAPLDRGAQATPQDQQRVDQIARKLEAVNPVKEPLKSDLLNGKWELLYTTSKSLLQTQRPKFLRPNGKIYQAINGDTLRAQNIETWPFYNQATANLVPLNSRRVAVKFDVFKIASLIPIKSPGSGRGQLEITYLDEDLRLVGFGFGYGQAVQYQIFRAYLANNQKS